MANKQAAGTTRLFSVRHEFPDSWAAFKRDDRPLAELRIDLRREHYPFWARTLLSGVTSVEVIARGGPERLGVAAGPDGANPDELVEDRELGGLRRGRLSDVRLEPVGELALFFGDNSMDELWLAVSWRGEEA
jgi:hypothetical protein